MLDICLKRKDKKMTKIITITSGKGGVGKTVTAINLASALNKLGKEVILVDGNFTTPNIAINLGSPVIPITLNHVLQGKKNIYDAIYEHHSGIKIVPASLSLKELKGIRTENFDKIINELKKYADYIIIDSAAGLGKEALIPFQIADELFIVTNPETAAITDALKTIKLAEKFSKNKKISIILNRIRKDKKELSHKEIKSLLEKPFIAKIPEDETFRESLMIRDALMHTHPESDAARAYERLAERIIGNKKENKINKEKEEQEVKKLSEKKNNFFSWMFREE